MGWIIMFTVEPEGPVQISPLSFQSEESVCCVVKCMIEGTQARATMIFHGHAHHSCQYLIADSFHTPPGIPVWRRKPGKGNFIQNFLD